MSDAHRDEIAKLEALFAEHPEGRIFTHLAEACRKAGDLERAREVLAEGIERHPDYSSAHVVLGRVLLDLGQLDEARSEFQRVLELDSQNLVAHRSLGDIARQEGRDQDALAHYEALLDLEPSDTDVRAVMEEMTAVPPPVEATAEVVEDAEVAEAAEAAEAAEDTAEEVAPVGEADWEAAEGGEAWDEAEAFEPFDAGEAEESEESEESEGAAWVEEEWTVAADDEDEWSTGVGAEDEDWVDTAASLDEEAEALTDDITDEIGAELEGASGEGADVMTETIAQVYARQGLYDRAIEVYRGLIERRPDDEGLRERLAEVEELAASEMVAADGPSADEASSADGEPYGAGSESAIQAEPTVEDMEPEVGAIDGLEPTEFETPAGDVAPIEGLEARDLDAETGLVAGAGAEEPGSADGEAEGEAEEAWSDAPWESAAEEEVGVEPGAPESDEAESPWMADDWSTAEDDAETPYAWAGEAEEEEEDGSSPIGDYLGQMLQWGAGMAPPTGPSAPAAGVVGAEDEAAAEAGGEPVDAPVSEPPNGEDDDDDLEMFRSWLESLKQ